jgi:predicted NBD/HSP70 family sugar kinase
MYIGVGVGGTKTLVAVLDEHGVIKEESKFPTPKKYDHFLLELRHTLAHFETQDFKAAGVALPGRLDRTHGRLIRLANLSWQNESTQADCEKIFNCPVVIENDANLAGLSEAMLQPDYDKVLYITISTGIGTGYTYKRQLDPSLVDLEGGQLLLPHKDKLMRWELFGSGRAIYQHFGKPASDIPASDVAAWKYVVRNLVVGFFANIAIVEPELIIIGGSIGSYFDRYGKLLQAELDKHEVPVVKIPKLIEAQRPKQAVVYGCYDLAKQVYGKN